MLVAETAQALQAEQIAKMAQAEVALVEALEVMAEIVLAETQAVEARLVGQEVVQAEAQVAEVVEVVEVVEKFLMIQVEMLNIQLTLQILTEKLKNSIIVFKLIRTDVHDVLKIWKQKANIINVAQVIFPQTEYVVWVYVLQKLIQQRLRVNVKVAAKTIRNVA